MKFIDDGLANGEGVIVHSARGHNRSIAVLCVYFMRKYRWTLYKTLQYMHSRRPDLEIRANFFNQLLALESRFQKSGLGAKTYNWEEVFTQGDAEELVLRNTYLNAQPQGVAEFKDHDQRPKQSKLRFAEKISMYIPPYEKITFQKRKPQVQSVKTILKMTQQSQQQVPLHQNLQSQPQPQPQLLTSPQNMQQQLPPPPNLNQAPQPLQPLQPVQPSQTQQQQRPQSQDVKRVAKSDSQKLIPEQQQEPPKPKKNNFMDSGEQFFLRSQKIQMGTQPPAQGRRPQTAPNQLKAPRLQVTPYKRNTSSGQRVENSGLQPNSQFKPMGNRQRAHSPNAVYNANPYVQKQFKQKIWKK